MSVICEGCGHRKVCQYAATVLDTEEKINNVLNESNVKHLLKVEVACKYIAPPNIIPRQIDNVVL